MRISTSLFLLVGLLFANGCTGTRKAMSPRILNYNYTQHGKGVAFLHRPGMPLMPKNKLRGSEPIALCVQPQTVSQN
jgi:hypothetical protein